MIRLGNTVRYAGRLWIVSGRSHRSDGTTRLIVVDERTNDTAVVLPSEVDDLGDFSRPANSGGYVSPDGAAPADDNRCLPTDPRR